MLLPDYQSPCKWGHEPSPETPYITLSVSTNSFQRNWVVDVPVLKRSLDLYLVQKRRDAWQDVAPAQEGFAMVHELRYGIDAIPNAFLQLRGDESDCFRLVEAQAPC